MNVVEPLEMGHSWQKWIVGIRPLKVISISGFNLPFFLVIIMRTAGTCSNGHGLRHSVLPPLLSWIETQKPKQIKKQTTTTTKPYLSSLKLFSQIFGHSDAKVGTFTMHRNPS